MFCKLSWQNVGQLLLDTAKNIGQTSGVTQFGWSVNHRALRFYTKNGFVVLTNMTL
jgi:GNAT superfamily N-acetyltransferase